MKLKFSSISKQQCGKAEFSGLSFQHMLTNLEGTEERHCLTQVQLLTQESLCTLETGESNLTRSTYFEMRYRQKTGLDSICIAFERVSTFLCCRRSLIVPCRYSKNNWPELLMVAMPVLQFFWIQPYGILHSAEVCKDSKKTISWIRSYSFVLEL